MEENPFPDFKISDFFHLEKAESRTPCLKCRKTRKYYCYTCFLPLANHASVTPKVKLPLKIDVIKHAQEVDGKSTAAHAAILAPDDVKVFTFPTIPDYKELDKIVMVFPDDEAQTISTWLGSRPNENDFISSKLEKVVFIDSTWSQTYKIASDERLKGLHNRFKAQSEELILGIPRVVLTEHETKFWRHQTGKPRTYLATIEAIYYFVTEYYKATNSEPYKGQFDDLLFYFAFMHKNIRTLYDGGHNLKAYKKAE